MCMTIFREPPLAYGWSFEWLWNFCVIIGVTVFGSLKTCGAEKYGLIIKFLVINSRYCNLKYYMTVLGETECNPNGFYPSIEESLWETFITKMINVFLAILILSYSPFIIYLPFRRKTLNTCCRKIISMIVFSDVISTLAHMELLLFRPWNETNASPCLIATITLAVAQQCSLHWLVWTY